MSEREIAAYKLQTALLTLAVHPQLGCARSLCLGLEQDTPPALHASQELSHQDIIRQLKLEHGKEVTKLRQEFELQVRPPNLQTGKLLFVDHITMARFAAFQHHS